MYAHSQSRDFSGECCNFSCNHLYPVHQVPSCQHSSGCIGWLGSSHYSLYFLFESRLSKWDGARERDCLCVCVTYGRVRVELENRQRGGLAHVLMNSLFHLWLSPTNRILQPLWQPLQTQSVLDKIPGLGCCLHGTRLIPCHSSESFQAPELFLAALAFNHNYDLSLLISSYWCLQVWIFTRAKKAPDSEKMYSILAGTSYTSRSQGQDGNGSLPWKGRRGSWADPLWSRGSCQVAHESYAWLQLSWVIMFRRTDRMYLKTLWDARRHV